jgi:hypothetical protein
VLLVNAVVLSGGRSPPALVACLLNVNKAATEGWSDSIASTAAELSRQK